MKKILYLVIPCTLDCIVFNSQELLTFFLAANTDGFPALFHAAHAADEISVDQLG